jgi:Glycosyl transferase family 11.
MIIIQVAGGLGNQMQQYALYRKFVKLGKEARLDISWFTQSARQEKVYAKRELELDYFPGISYQACTMGEKEALLGDGSLVSRLSRKIGGKLFPASRKVFQETQMYHPGLFECEDKYLCGYFACEKYYADILGELREQFCFPVSGNPENARLAQRMRAEESVSVHVRRGDYLDPENARLFGNICTERYYEGAVGEMKRIYPQAHFYLFSDDAAYVKERFRGEEYTVVDINQGKDSFYDIWLMSNCRHNICANSTFSFWGARLNGNREKVMVRPWIHKNTQKFDSGQMHGLWEGWVLMDNGGNVV